MKANQSIVKNSLRKSFKKAKGAFHLWARKSRLAIVIINLQKIFWSKHKILNKKNKKDQKVKIMNKKY